ncbi:MAG: hypothetical protein CMJ78_26005 [Planctomycetaceae bacterium]|nr:hypothetical protein [Planctomycetaceae bacterium]
MRKLRNIIKWAFILLLVGGGIGGGVAYQQWTQRGELIRKEILAQFSDKAPQLDVAVGQCRFDFLRHVRIEDFSVKVKGQKTALTKLPLTVITIDRDLLLQDTQISVDKIHFKQPRLQLACSANGVWNFEGLPELPKSGKGVLPEVRIEDGEVAIYMQHEQGAEPALFTLDDVNIELVPSGRRKFQLRGQTRIEHAGVVNLNGEFSVDDKTGEIKGKLEELTIGSKLFGAIAAMVPEADKQWHNVRNQLIAEMSKAPDPQSSSPFSIAGMLSRNEALPVSYTNDKTNGPFAMVSASSDVPNKNAKGFRDPLLGDTGANDSTMGVVATVDLNFWLKQWQISSDPEYKVLIDLNGGEITNPVLPFPLHDLRGSIYVDNRQIVCRNIFASNGPTRIEVESHISQPVASASDKVEVKIVNLACDERLRSRLSANFGRIYDAHQPEGYIDFEVALKYDGREKWEPRGLVVTSKRAGVTHKLFPLPVKNAVGTITQQDNNLVIDMKGFVGARPVTLKGYVQEPGPNSSILFDINVEKLPIDEEFINAAPPGLKKTIQAMALTGTMNGHLRLWKPSGTKKFQPTLEATLHNGAMNYAYFPYEVTNLTGELRAVGDDWTFTNLKGVHGDAKLYANGTYQKPNGVSELKLRVNTTGAPIDRSLKSAFKSAQILKLWEDFSPTGTVNVVTDVHWLVGSRADITMPRVEQFDGSFKMKSLPYLIDNVRATYTYQDGKVEIQSFEGTHDATSMTAKGKVDFDREGWTARLEQFVIKDLSPNEELKNALKTAEVSGLVGISEALSDDQLVSIGGMLELRGTDNPKDPMTAAWDLAAFLKDGDIDIGPSFESVSGRVDARGIWDGYSTTMAGSIDLTALTVLDYEFEAIRGPFEFQDNVLTIGSKDAFAPKFLPANRIAPQQSIKAKAIGGDFSFHSQTKLSDIPTYQIKMNMSHAKLQQYAKKYMPESENLSGTMRGWMNLSGEGEAPANLSGSGQLQVQQAELYELPVLLQVFEALSDATPDRAAFDYAMLDFKVKNSRFNFNSIDLEGDTINLHARGGFAGFDKSLELDFYSRLSRTQVPIPVLNQLTAGWVGVDVRGNLDDPKAEIKPAPLLDDALKGFLRSFKLRPPQRAPVFQGGIARPLRFSAPQ